MSILIVLTMILSLLAGCASSTASTNKTSGISQPVTLTVYSQLANYSGELTGWFAQELLERFNVKIVIVPDAVGVYSTRMEAGNLGDIVIWGGDGDDYKAAVEAGLLFDWHEDDLLDEFGPYIKEHMPYALQKNMEISGGTLYGFGHNVATSSQDIESFFYTWDIRWDLYKQLGYPPVNHLDDLIEVMAKMKEIAPLDDAGNPTYAVSLWPDWDGTMVMYVKSMATAYYGHDELGIGLYNVETGEFYDALMENGPYLEMLKFFNKLNQRDLLDPNSIVQTFDEVTAKVQNGGTFFSIFNFAGSLSYNSDTHLAQNKMMLTLTPNEATPIVYGMNVMGSNRIWSIGASTQYPELCMEIINWLSTPEGRMISDYGPKDICWYYDDEGYTHATDLGKLMHNDRTTQFPQETGYHGAFNDGANQMNNTTWSVNAKNPDSKGETYNRDMWKSNRTAPVNDTEADWRQRFGVNSVEEYLRSKDYKISLGTAYSESRKSDELKVVWAQTTKAIIDYSWKAIYAKTDREFDIIVKQMVKTANDYGYEKCVSWSLGEAKTRKALEDALD
jgi:putative aldouronate transport system substrate-binding protein